MYTRKSVIAYFLACVGVSAALACGPDFPWQLLDNRAETLTATPANSFDFEAVHLAPQPADSLRAIEGPLFMTEDSSSNPLNKEETEGLTVEQVALVGQMRAADNDEDAFARGTEISMDARLYIAGAVAFHQGNVERAISRFQAILQLPENDQRSRATWATFMLGRSYGLLGDIEKAGEAFKQTRDFAINGLPDPLGLAVASYGEEARLHLNQANNYLLDGELPAENTAEYAHEIAATVALYAEQAARGSQIGALSLRFVAEQQLHTPTRLRAVVADPLVQRLLVAYVLARVSDIPVHLPWRESSGEYKFAMPLDPLVIALVDAIAQRGLEHPVGADRLAALAYRGGRYDLAEQLVTNTSGPLASWVKAKLALQKGELATAAGFYADAAKAFPTVDGSLPLDGENVRLLTGESGVLALARGEYVNALEQLYPVASTYWGDVAHLADRVLTVEELKRFVDAKVPVPAEIHPHQEAAEESSSYLYTLAQPYPATQLRDLLARRLVREGRYQEALPYFHTPNDPHFSDHEVETHVTAYVQALHEAEKSWRRIERARAWYQAAVLARRFGMEMMGYEAAPDFFAIGGSFDFGLGQTTIGGPFVTDGERQRFLASAAHPEARYHYRYRAVEHINRAADLLPPRSQAFAAVLCRATGWMLGTPGAEKLAQDLYHRYVQQGPYVAWATHFGRRCPEPDFTAAARFARTQPFRDASHFARQHRWSLGLGFLALIGLILTGLIRRQRTSLESDR